MIYRFHELLFEKRSSVLGAASYPVVSLFLRISQSVIVIRLRERNALSANMITSSLICKLKTCSCMYIIARERTARRVLATDRCRIRKSHEPEYTHTHTHTYTRAHSHGYRSHGF